MKRDVLVVLQHADQFLAGLLNTLWLAGATLALASILGCAVAAMMLSPQRILRLPTRLLVDAMRTVPFLRISSTTACRSSV